MLIRRAALDDVGLFDEGYWMYMEDLDLCYRFQAAGWRVLYEPRAVASHLKGGSAGRHRGPRLNAAFHYGMFRFYRKFYAPSRPAPANLAVYAGIAAKLAFSVVGQRRVLALVRSAPRGGRRPKRVQVAGAKHEQVLIPRVALGLDRPPGPGAEHGMLGGHQPGIRGIEHHPSSLVRDPMEGVLVGLISAPGLPLERHLQRNPVLVREPVPDVVEDEEGRGQAPVGGERAGREPEVRLRRPRATYA